MASRKGTVNGMTVSQELETEQGETAQQVLEEILAKEQLINKQTAYQTCTDWNERIILPLDDTQKAFVRGELQPLVDEYWLQYETAIGSASETRSIRRVNANSAPNGGEDKISRGGALTNEQRTKASFPRARESLYF